MIITRDRPLGSDCQSVKRIFFNGYYSAVRGEMLAVSHKVVITTMRGMKRNCSRVFIWDGLIFIWSLYPKMLDAWFSVTRI